MFYEKAIALLYLVLACIVNQKTRLFQNSMLLLTHVNVSVTFTYIGMHQGIIKFSITTETTYNFAHINTSTTENTEINTIISAKLANYTL